MIEDQNVVWISHSSRLYRCAPEHLRMLSSREVGENPEPSEWTLPSTTGTGVFQFTDLSMQPVVEVPPNAVPENPTVPPATGEHPAVNLPTTMDGNAGDGDEPSTHGQPDAEPEVISIPSQNDQVDSVSTDGVQVPVPSSDNEDALTIIGKYCMIDSSDTTKNLDIDCFVRPSHHIVQFHSNI